MRHEDNPRPETAATQDEDRIIARAIRALVDRLALLREVRRIEKSDGARKDVRHLEQRLALLREACEGRGLVVVAGDGRETVVNAILSEANDLTWRTDAVIERAEALIGEGR